MKGKVFLCLALLLTGLPIAAYEVSPIYQVLDSFGSKSQSSYTLKNIDSEPIMVEVFAYSVELVDGEEILTPADEQFLILPPQAKINGEGYQNFRVRFIPNQGITETKPYRVIFKQLQIPSENKTQNEVEMLINFSTLAFVSPPKSTANPVANVEKGVLRLKNEGNKVLDMRNVMFEFVTLDGKEAAVLSDITKDSSLYLLPGFEKKFELTDEFVNSSDVDLTYKP